MMTASENAARSDLDPAGWSPLRDGCRYALEWIAVKSHWGLSVDSAEKTALSRLLGTCASSGAETTVAAG